MAARKLASNTVVVGENGGGYQTFLAGDTPPEWAAKQVTNEECWEPAAKPSRNSKAADSDNESDGK